MKQNDRKNKTPRLACATTHVPATARATGKQETVKASRDLWWQLTEMRRKVNEVQEDKSRVVSAVASSNCVHTSR